MQRLLFIIAFLLLSFSVHAQLRGDIYFQQNGGDFIAQLAVYPNPSTTGDFTVEFSSLNPHQDIYIRVYSLIGKEVFSKTIPAANGFYEEQFSVQQMPRGVYFLEISNGEQKQTRRLSYI
jgi:hypothetical protein